VPEHECVLIVDDEEPIREVISSLLETQGYQCETAPTAVRALPMIAAYPTRYQLVLSDIIMPEMSGLDFLKRIQEQHPEIPVVMLSAVHDIRVALDAIREGAYDYLVKPFEKDQLFFSVQRALERRRLIGENRRYQLHLEELVAERTQQLEQALARLERSYDYTLEALGSALDMKDSGTEGHSKRVTAFAMAIAKAMGLSSAEIRTVARGAYLHDIGKIAVPDAVLRKPGPLTAEEREVIQAHCDHGWQMLRRISFLEEPAEVVLAHQEHYDGSGYPRGLKGEEIHLGARIFAVADALDAMISDRPYRSALSLDQALDEIGKMAGRQFDPQVVKAMLSLPAELWRQLQAGVGKGYGVAAAGGPAG
jgi:putative nucleotidyltransferase with HDIG domain